MLGAGSGGLALVLHQALAHRPDADAAFARARDAFRAVAAQPLTYQCGLYHGGPELCRCCSAPAAILSADRRTR